MADLTTLVASAGQWSFKSDEALFKLVMDMADGLKDGVKSILDGLDRMELDVRTLDIKLQNATSRLNLASDSKFLEARVYEAEDMLEGDDVAAEDNANREAETGEQAKEEMVQVAVNNGVAMVEKFFEQVKLVDSDSEEDEDLAAQQAVSLVVKNPYMCRLLPHIIGSSEWNEDDFVGLMDAQNDSDEESESDEDVDPEEDDGADDHGQGLAASESEYSDSDSEDSKTVPAVTANPQQSSNVSIGLQEDSLSDEDSLSSSNDLHKVDGKDNQPPEAVEDPLGADNPLVSPRPNFAQELSRKLGLPASSSSVKEDNAKPSDDGVTKKSLESDQATKKPGKKPVAKSVLFDSDSDDDLFKVPASKLPPKPQHAPTSQEDNNDTKPVQVTQDQHPDVQDGQTEAIPPEKPKTELTFVAASKLMQARSLFSEDEDSDDEIDDLFSNLRAKKNNTDGLDKSKGNFGKPALFEKDEDSAEDSADDLFANLKITKKPEPALKNSSDSKLPEPEPPTPKSNGLETGPLVQKSMEIQPAKSDDLILGTEDILEPKPSEPKGPQTKAPPAGGVALLAGLGLALKSKLPRRIGSSESSQSDHEADDHISEPKPREDKTTEVGGGADLYPKANGVPETQPPRPGTSEITTQGLASKQSVDPFVGDFGEGLGAGLLVNVTKTRPRLQKGRRQQSRASRLSKMTDQSEARPSDSSSMEDMLQPPKIEANDAQVPDRVPAVGQRIDLAVGKSAKSKGLFDFDDDSDDDLFGKPQAKADKKPTEGLQLVMDGNNDQASNRMKLTSVKVEGNNDKKGKSKLFDSDGDDSEDDLFSSFKVPPPMPVGSETKPKQPTSFMFDDDEEDDDDDLFSNLLSRK